MSDSSIKLHQDIHDTLERYIRKYVWSATYAASISHGDKVNDAKRIADAALDAFNHKFP